MAINLKDLSFEKKIVKPWGEEIIYTPEDLKYTFKLIKINDGCKLSLQSHTEKVETFILISGKANLIIGESLEDLETVPMEIGKGYNISLGTIHRMEGVQDASILEASTPETGITLRYQDDYNRPDETEEIRKLDNRGWSKN